MSRQDCRTAVMAGRLVMVLALVTRVVVSSEVSSGEPPVSGDRLAELQRVVEQQDTRLARQDQQLTTALAAIAALPALRLQLAEQEVLLAQLNHKVADQDQKMAAQDQKMAAQDQKMVEQEALLADQDALVGYLNLKVAAQDMKLADQDQKLAEQEALTGQLKENLANQKALVRQLNHKVAEQEELIGQLNHKLDSHKLKLSDQETLCAQLNQNLADKSHEAADLGATWRLHTGQSSDTHATDQPSPLLGSEAHDVMARADDTDPLQGVVAALSQQVTEMSADFQALQHGQQQQTRDIRAASSSVFVRWGAAACDSSSQLVYSGVVGGSHYTHSGAATNNLCLTLSPVMSSHAVPRYLALLYGAEYETLESHQNHNPVCAVCRSSFPTTLMVPGTNVCSPGWRLLYSGYLMAGYYSHAAGSEFVCVDSSLQAVVGNSADENGKTLYFTASRCGSLPCPPYENNKVVTCAVCAQ